MNIPRTGGHDVTADTPQPRQEHNMRYGHDCPICAAWAAQPSREVLLARFAGALAAPMVQFAGLLQALPRNFAYGLSALIEKGGAGSADAAPADTPTPTTEEEN